VHWLPSLLGAACRPPGAARGFSEVKLLGAVLAVICSGIVDMSVALVVASCTGVVGVWRKAMGPTIVAGHLKCIWWCGIGSSGKSRWGRWRIRWRDIVGMVGTMESCSLSCEVLFAFLFMMVEM
jgi:hypothetical protein